MSALFPFVRRNFLSVPKYLLKVIIFHEQIITFSNQVHVFYLENKLVMENILHRYCKYSVPTYVTTLLYFMPATWSEGFQGPFIYSVNLFLYESFTYTYLSSVMKVHEVIFVKERRHIYWIHLVNLTFIQVLTDSVMILSNSIIGGMWKSNTKYWNKKRRLNYVLKGIVQARLYQIFLLQGNNVRSHSKCGGSFNQEKIAYKGFNIPKTYKHYLKNYKSMYEYAKVHSPTSLQ